MTQPQTSAPGQKQFAMPQATLELAGTPVTVKAVHPFPPLPMDVGRWAAELDGSREFAESVQGPLIMGGDFNADRNHALTASAD